MKPTKATKHYASLGENPQPLKVGEILATHDKVHNHHHRLEPPIPGGEKFGTRCSTGRRPRETQGRDMSKRKWKKEDIEIYHKAHKDLFRRMHKDDDEIMKSVKEVCEK